MYNSPWGSYVKHGGKWDFKNNKAPFNKVNEKTMSKYFYYKGNRKTYRLQGQNHLPGLLRYDDPGNMCYGATGKILLSGLDGVFEKWMLQQFADMYALLNEPEYKHLADDQWELFFTYLKKLGPFRSFDDKWDLAAINYGYDVF